LPLLTEPVREEGTLWFQAPDKFRREVPGGSVTVSDGQTLWLYYPEVRQAEKYPLARNRLLSDSLRAITAALNLQNEGKQFAIRIEENNGGYRVDLTPLRGAMRKAVQSISVWLSASLNLEKIQIRGTQGEDTQIQFSEERPLKPGEGDFTFSPPQGVNVSEPLGR
jgi:outer membrane lipoprotein-sorting protein